MNQAEDGGDARRSIHRNNFTPEKEELFFAIDEKSHEADLTEKGRNFLSPKDPDAFMLPDLTTDLHEIDTGPESDPRKRLDSQG